MKTFESKTFLLNFTCTAVLATRISGMWEIQKSCKIFMNWRLFFHLSWAVATIQEVEFIFIFFDISSPLLLQDLEEATLIMTPVLWSSAAGAIVYRILPFAQTDGFNPAQHKFARSSCLSIRLTPTTMLSSWARCKTAMCMGSPTTKLILS